MRDKGPKVPQSICNENLGKVILMGLVKDQRLESSGLRRTRLGHVHVLGPARDSSGELQIYTSKKHKMSSDTEQQSICRGMNYGDVSEVRTQESSSCQHGTWLTGKALHASHYLEVASLCVGAYVAPATPRC